jgi:nucleoside 2-deoxyribosyltransferase
MTYSDIKDFRHRSEQAAKILCHDLEYVNKADVLIVLADKPSDGTAMEWLLEVGLEKRGFCLPKTQFLLRANTFSLIM